MDMSERDTSILPKAGLRLDEADRTLDMDSFRTSYGFWSERLS